MASIFEFLRMGGVERRAADGLYQVCRTARLCEMLQMHLALMRLKQPELGQLGVDWAIDGPDILWLSGRAIRGIIATQGELKVLEAFADCPLFVAILVERTTNRVSDEVRELARQVLGDNFAAYTWRARQRWREYSRAWNLLIRREEARMIARAVDDGSQGAYEWYVNMLGERGLNDYLCYGRALDTYYNQLPPPAKPAAESTFEFIPNAYELEWFEPKPGPRCDDSVD